MTEQQNQLRDLVDQLTGRHDVPVIQHGQLKGHRTQKPLLDLLADARVEDLGRGNGTTARHERITLNTAASELHTAITRRIKRWALHANVPIHTGHWDVPTTLLREWQARVYLNSALETYIATLEQWVHQITELVVDPARRWSISDACPACNQRWALDTDGQRIDTLQVSERDPAESSDIQCRNCGARWQGLHGFRRLRIAIDETRRLGGAA